ncbi:helix-turn-helix domain-containing protein, partial [Nostoc sp. NIES-2111]
ERDMRVSFEDVLGQGGVSDHGEADPQFASDASAPLGGPSVLRDGHESGSGTHAPVRRQTSDARGVSAAQLRAARRLLGLSVAELADASGVPARTIRGLEKAGQLQRLAAPELVVLRRTLMGLGVVFVGTPTRDPGVRLRRRRREAARPSVMRGGDRRHRHRGVAP